MIIVTGGAGFIGSNIVHRLNQDGIADIIIVDDLSKSDKWRYLNSLTFSDYVHKDEFLDTFVFNHSKRLTNKVQAVIHMGACSSTTEMDADFLWKNNTQFTKILAEWAIQQNSRFIYASSAATYGDGSLGFDDDESNIEQLKPLNPYGWSKQQFDLWAKSNHLFDQIVGLKFFNVFGPNEGHKGSMRSMICKAKEQIDATDQIKLFKSYLPEYSDGGQMRDFIYVKDCTNMISWLLDNPHVNGLFNYGFGEARTWNDLSAAVFTAMDKPVNIEYVEMPDNIKHQYQYHTKANMEKLRRTSCPMPSYTLEEAVEDYVVNYLS